VILLGRSVGPERFATSLGGQPVADAAKWDVVSQDACGVQEYAWHITLLAYDCRSWEHLGYVAWAVRSNYCAGVSGGGFEEGIAANLPVRARLSWWYMLAAGNLHQRWAQHSTVRRAPHLTHVLQSQHRTDPASACRVVLRQTSQLQDRALERHRTREVAQEWPDVGLPSIQTAHSWHHVIRVSASMWL